MIVFSKPFKFICNKAISFTNPYQVTDHFV